MSYLTKQYGTEIIVASLHDFKATYALKSKIE